MTRLVSIHQPNFLPWPGYWLKQAVADLHVIHANCALNASGYTRRVKIKSPSGDAHWLSVPLLKQASGKLITEVAVRNSIEDQQKMLNKLKGNYTGLAYFAPLLSRLRVALEHLGETPSLAKYNLVLAKALSPSFFEAPRQMISDDELSPIEKRGPLRLVQICEKTVAEVYVAGLGSQRYLKASHFARSSTRLEWFDAAKAAKQTFPEVPFDESVVHIISLIGEQAFAARTKAFGINYRKALQIKWSK